MKRLLIAAMALLLAGCVFTPLGANFSVKLPHTSQYYVACFNKLTPIPVGNLDRATVVRLIAELRVSELRLSQCGKDMIAWYDTVVKAYGKA